MLRYKAINILKSFSKEDIKKFHLFINSPYFNTQKKVAYFYNILSKFHPDFSEKMCCNETLMRKLNTSSLSTLKNLFADLFKLLEKYIAQDYFEKNKYYNKKAVLSAIISRELYQLFEHEYKKIKDPINFTTQVSRDDIKFNSFLNGIKIEYLDNSNTALKENKDITGVIELEGELYLNYLKDFLIQSLSSSTKFISYSIPYDYDLKSDFSYKKISNILSSIGLNSLISELISLTENKYEADLIKMYYYIYKFRTNNQESAIEDFKKFMNLLVKNSSALELNQKYIFYQELRWLFMFVMKYPKYENIEFQFYNNYLKEKAFIGTGKSFMLIGEFKHLMVRGDNCMRYTWTNKLIKNFSKYLKPEDRDKIIPLRNAYINLRVKKSPKAAIEELKKIPNGAAYDIRRDSQNFYIMAYYELNNFDEVRARCDSFRHFLKNQSMTDKYSNPFKRFIKFVLKLTSYKESGKELKENLCKQIINVDIVVCKNWLLEKVDELRKD